MTERRDKIIEALAGVDLTKAYFTWSSPTEDDSMYCIWVHSGGKQFRVWWCDTRDEVLAVRHEMQVLFDAVERVAT